MTWTLPGLGRITSPYGPRKLAGAIGDFHYGTDLGTKRTQVFAAADGIVRTIWRTAKGAWVLDIRHADEGGRQVRTRYIHMYREDIAVKVGERVSRGQVVGLSGASGTSAAHLHFEVMVNGVNADPVPFMAARGVALGSTTVSNPGAGTGTVPVAPTVTAPTPIEEDDMYTDDDRQAAAATRQHAANAERNSFAALKVVRAIAESLPDLALDVSQSEANAYRAQKASERLLKMAQAAEADDQKGA